MTGNPSVTLAIAIQSDTRISLELADVTEDVVSRELMELVAEVITTQTRQPFTAEKGVQALPVFSVIGQRLDLCLTILIARSSVIYGIYPVIEEGIRQAVHAWLSQKELDLISFTAQIIIIDRNP
jgi:hypothetical protein